MYIRMNFLLFNLISYIGVILIFIAYGLNRLIKFNPKIYNILNMIGGILLTIYSIYIDNIVFTVLNIVWSVIAMTDLFLYHRKEI